MAALLSNLRNTIIAGFVLALIVFLIYAEAQGYDPIAFWPFFVRWLHVICGIMWIGLLWYFNFVQTPVMPKIPDDLKKGVSGYIAPEALFWFRWGAMGTIVFGIILAAMNGYLLEAFSLGAMENFTVPKHIGIGIGMWLGTIMWFNVWFIIWPNQQKVLNIGGKYPNLSPEAKAAAAKTAGQYSRINTLFSIPMLFSMVAAQNIY
ncbi:MAG TPA: urate hydroxylase PuuD [Rhizomicrobium sp.]|nr:urate hydroxylase PuuD [Rhizomicrobium sp.]